MDIPTAFLRHQDCSTMPSPASSDDDIKYDCKISKKLSYDDSSEQELPLDSPSSSKVSDIIYIIYIYNIRLMKDLSHLIIIYVQQHGYKLPPDIMLYC